MDWGEENDVLEVHAVGAYKISIAKNIADLKRIDKTVFEVSKNIDEILSHHYANNFGFIICGFDASSGVAPHPIGYVHDRMSDGKLFVPTRHEHGEHHRNDTKFDHAIYSVNTNNSCGESTDEIPGIAEQKPLFVLAKEPLLKHIDGVTCLRRMKINGLHANDDLKFTTIPSAETSKKEYSQHMQKMQELEKMRGVKQ